MGTWKARTLITEVQLSFHDAPVNITGFSPVKKIWFPRLLTTPFTHGLLKWNAKVIGNFCPYNALIYTYAVSKLG